MTRLTKETLANYESNANSLYAPSATLPITRHDLLAMIVELIERRAREDWRPIKSAPREELVLLGWPDTHDQYCGYWDEDGWTDASDDEVFPHQPTHFKRLTLGPSSSRAAWPQEG